MELEHEIFKVATPPHSKIRLLQAHVSEHENTLSKLLSLPAIYVDDRMFQINKVQSQCQADKRHWWLTFHRSRKLL